MRALLSQVEATALASLLAPLKLPVRLDDPERVAQSDKKDSNAILGMFISGFALHDEDA